LLLLFSRGDDCVLAVVLLDDGRDDRRELARRARHAEGEGDICTVPNSFSEGGGARRRPNVDQSPRRSMKPRCPVGALLLEELLVWLGFGESDSTLAVGTAGNALASVGPNIGVGGLLELCGPRRTGGERPRLIDDGSEASSFVRRSRSRYILRVAGAGACTCTGGSLRGSLSGSSCVGVVTVVAVVGAGYTNWAEWCEAWLTARVRRRDKMDGIAPMPIAASSDPHELPSVLRVPLSILRGAVGRSAVGSGPPVASKWA
jgi:hypothetical protein